MVFASAPLLGPTTMVTETPLVFLAKTALVMPWFSVGGMMTFQSSGIVTVKYLVLSSSATAGRASSIMNIKAASFFNMNVSPASDAST